jgi:hypothetical protein
VRHLKETFAVVYGARENHWNILRSLSLQAPRSDQTRSLVHSLKLVKNYQFFVIRRRHWTFATRRSQLVEKMSLQKSKGKLFYRLCVFQVLEPLALFNVSYILGFGMLVNLLSKVITTH